MAQDTSGPKNVTEVVHFSQFQQNNEEADMFGVTKQLNGCLRSYHGLKMNSDGSPGTDGVWVQEWVSLDHHTAFQNSPEYPAFVARAISFTNPERFEIRHVRFQPYPASSAFSAPLTEISIVSLKPTTTSEAFEAQVKETQAAFDTLSYGAILEDTTRKTYQIVNGWESIEEFQRALANCPLSKKLREIAEFDTGLYKLAE